MADDILQLIEAHHLMVRPTLLGRWFAGRFVGITGPIKQAHAYCITETQAEADTLEDAVRLAAEREQAWHDSQNWLDPETGEITWAKRDEHE